MCSALAKISESGASNITILAFERDVKVDKVTVRESPAFGTHIL